MATNGKASTKDLQKIDKAALRTAQADAVEAPRFDFRRVDGNWRRELRRVGAAEVRAQNRLQALYERGDFTDEELDAVMDEAEALDEKQNALIAMVLVAVPSEWLIYDAPERIDWSKPESIDYVAQDRRTALYTGMILAAGNPAGN